MSVFEDYVELFSLLTFFLGLWLGHWLALSREKRQEFNVAAAPIRDWLLKEIENPNPSRKWPSVSEVDRFSNKLNWLRRHCFKSSFDQQSSARKAVEKRDSSGALI